LIREIRRLSAGEAFEDFLIIPLTVKVLESPPDGMMYVVAVSPGTGVMGLIKLSVDEAFVGLDVVPTKAEISAGMYNGPSDIFVKVNV
jgi:hypothetical protein